jgi:hypothetical protein
MEIKLNQQYKQELEAKHKNERDRRIADRIKAVLLCSEGWTNRQIAQALRLNEETVFNHLSDFVNLEKLKPENGGSESKLNKAQSAELVAFLIENTFTSTAQIQQHIFFQYRISYSLQGVYNWLLNHGFSYKKPKEVPSKADESKQKEFIKTYEKLKEEAKENSEPILFIDSVHPTMATKVSYGWIRKGENKLIKTTASRTRINLSGAIDLNEMKVISESFESIDGSSTVAFLSQVRDSYSKEKKIHIILDNSGYHKAKEVKNFAENNKIELHFLPPYSPNLNPIERLWKLMNERVRNNQFFNSPTEFRQKINQFFTHTIPAIPDILQNRITDKFHVVSSAC